MARWTWIALILSLGCADSKGMPTDSEGTFSVSGTLRNDSQTQLPEELRVVVVWNVVEGDDHNLLFGEGTVDAEAMTFEIVFAEDVPSSALNFGTLGVGYILLTTNSALEAGILRDEDWVQDVVGGAGEYGVIFTNGDTQGLGWPEQFPSGYGVGRRIQLEESSFEGFEPVDAAGVEIIIVDNIEDIAFVNWS